MNIILWKRYFLDGRNEFLNTIHGALHLEDLNYDEIIMYLEKNDYTYYRLIGDLKSELILCYKNNYKDIYDGIYKKILETSHDEIWVGDKEGRTIYCNKSFERNYGIKREEMIGKTAMYLVENGYSDQTPVLEVMKTKKTSTMDQNTITGRKLVITASPLLNVNSEIEFIVENCRDITEIEDMKKQLVSQNIEIEKYKNKIDAIKTTLNKQSYLKDFKSERMKKILDSVDRVAGTNATILLQGESGTGKSEIAKYIHEKSARKDFSMVTINCTTIPDELFESEFFGYESGSFTGAKAKGKKGLIELADNGTIFLDEIGEIPLQSQAKLLQFIQDKTFTKVGGDVVKSVDVRIIAATNRVLMDLVESKKFREDLFYRLNVVNICIPPLRKRKEDITLFLSYFLEKFNQEYAVKKSFDQESQKYLAHYSWPGNIREFQNLIHNLIIMTKDTLIRSSDLPPALLIESDYREENQEMIDLKHIMNEYENAIVRKCYERNNSSYKLAKALNISQSTATRLIKKHI